MSDGGPVPGARLVNGDQARFRAAMRPAIVVRLGELRGWTAEKIERLELGFDGERVTFPVRDATGELLGHTYYSPNGTEPKMLADSGVPRELFPPPEMIGDDDLARGGTLWLVEGPPDAVRLWSLGLAAVAIPSTSIWKPGWAARFTGRRWSIVVCFDCDEAGRKGAARAAADLAAAGVDVRVIDLAPDRDDGYDLTDFAAGAGLEQLDQVAALLVAIAERTPVFVAPAGEESRPGSVAGPLDPVLGVRSFAAHRGRPVTFLRPGVPMRNVTCVAGDGGVGKSLLVLGWAADVVATDGEALVVVAEDGADEAKLRLRALEVDLERVHFLTLEWGLDESGTPDYDAAAVSLPEQADPLDGIVAALGNGLRLVVIDPWAECLDDSVDSHIAKSLRRAIAALRRIASHRDVAVVVVAHLNKSAALSLRKRIDGSGALYDGSRSVFLLAQDPDDDDTRVLAHGKSNISELLPAREYRLEPILIEADGSEPEGRTARIVDGDAASARTVEDLLGERRNGDDDAKAVDEAAAWLASALADREWHDSAGVKVLAAAQKIAERTLKRAAKQLGVEHDWRGFPASTWWRLTVGPTAAADGPTDEALAQLPIPHEHRDSDVSEPSRATQSDGGLQRGPTGAGLVDEPRHDVDENRRQEGGER